MIGDARHALGWLRKTSRENVKHLAKLRIFPHAVYHRGPHPALSGQPADSPGWCELFNKLVSEAKCLREIYIYWGAELAMGHFGGGFRCRRRSSAGTHRGAYKLENRWVLRPGVA